VSDLINNYPYYYDKNKINIYDINNTFPFDKSDIIIINDIYKFDYLFNIINNVISILKDDGILIIETSAQNINKLENAFPKKYNITKSETSIIIKNEKVIKNQ
jgi:methylase of polypeptide subunit release factors